MACMRVCPTQAIRVRDGKAKVLPALCVDCGFCLSVCPTNSIQPTTRSFADLDRFKFKVAVPSPVLFGQFPQGISPAHIIAGLKGIGFDAVWNFAVDIALVNRAIRDYVTSWTGPFPLISIACPVIVRLVQVLYPRMIDQLLRVQVPREVAAREAKRKYSAELGISREEIAAVYITPLPGEDHLHHRARRGRQEPPGRRPGHLGRVQRHPRPDPQPGRRRRGRVPTLAGLRPSHAALGKLRRPGQQPG